jgi:hypothetical protein
MSSTGTSIASVPVDGISGTPVLSSAPDTSPFCCSFLAITSGFESALL